MMTFNHAKAAPAIHRTACCVDVVADTEWGPECRSCGCPGARMVQMDPTADGHLFELTDDERAALEEAS